MGAPRSTPTNLLKIELDIETISRRWDWLATSFYLKKSQQSNSPLSNTVAKLLWEEPKPSTRNEPAPTRTGALLTALGVPKPTPDPARLATPPWKSVPAEFYHFKLKKKEALNNQKEAMTLFQESLGKEDVDHYQFYTDGSVWRNSKTAACGVYCPKLKLKMSWKLRPSSSIFTTESIAIEKTLEVVDEKDIQSVTIFTDSAAAMGAIMNKKERHPKTSAAGAKIKLRGYPATWESGTTQ